MPGRRRRLSGDERERVDGGVEGRVPPAREIRGVDQGRRRRERVPGHGPIAGGGEFGRNQQRDDAARRGELHRALEKRDGQVRPVAEPASRASPPAIAALQPPAHLRRHLFGAKPGGFPATMSKPPPANTSAKWL